MFWKVKYYIRKIITNIFIMFSRKKVLLETGKKLAIIFLAPDYGNMGDIAICSAQKKMLQDVLGEEYQVVEISVGDVYKTYNYIQKHVKKDSVITLIGGGNNGDLYTYIEERRIFLLRKFKKNKIISFPQTVCYKEKNKEFYKKKFVRAANACENLTIIAREQESFEIYKSMLKCDVLLCPDIVFSLNCDFQKRRQGVQFIFRDDKEKSVSNKDKENVIEIFKKMNYKVFYQDTCDNGFANDKEIKLKSFMNEMSNKKIVVTDRLHGMILAYITKTPCIVFENNNHKIKSTYETWLKSKKEILLIDNVNYDEIEKFIKQVDDKMSFEPLNEKYKELKRIIKEGCI